MRVHSVIIGFACALLAVVGCSNSDVTNPTSPGPTGRFHDNANGTVTDTQTGLVWLKKADCFAASGQSWDTAMTAVAGLKHGDCGLTDHSSPGDWRLPSVQCPAGMSCDITAPPTGEFVTIVAPACSPTIPNTAGTGCWHEGDPFTGINIYDSYWSSTSYDATYAWGIEFSAGGVVAGNKGQDFLVWPVRNGP